MNTSIPYEKNQKDRVPFETYKAQFEKKDPELMSEISGVPFDKETGNFELTLMNKKYLVHHPDFTIVCLDEDQGIAPLLTDFNAKILIVRYLLEAKKATSKGQFYAYADMPWGNHYNAVFQGRCVKRLAFSFGFSLNKFIQVMESLGAEKLSVGDAGYEFKFLDDLKLQFILWEGDEEFPPSAQILFADNFASAFTGEDMAYVGDISIGCIKALSKRI